MEFWSQEERELDAKIEPIKGIPEGYFLDEKVNFKHYLEYWRSKNYSGKTN